MFFWVFLRRQYVICRRFGTMYQFYLQGLEVVYRLLPAFEDGTDQYVICRRFGTMYQFHLQGLEVVYRLLPAFEDGTDTWFRNVSKLHVDAGEIPKRTYTIFKSRRKLEIYKEHKC